MNVDVRLANKIHSWLINEGKGCETEQDLDSASDRFLKVWPRVRPNVLLYVSQKLRAEMHVRTYWSSKILERAQDRITVEPGLRHRWWQPGFRGMQG